MIAVLSVKIIRLCWNSSINKNTQYKNNLLGNNSIKVAIEAASSYGWERYIGTEGIFIGLDSFGASAPAPTLYEHFRITVESVVKECRSRLAQKK